MPVPVWPGVDGWRRQVFSVAVIYVVAAWVLLQVVDVIQDEINVDVRLVLTAAIIGFPIALVAGWREWAQRIRECNSRALSLDSYIGCL